MKINLKELRTEHKNHYIDALYRALDHAKNRNEVKSFINDLLTESEKIMLGRRIVIAKKLMARQSYENIVQELGVGLDTVYRVKKWLGGRYQGYEKIIEDIRKMKPRKKRNSGFSDYYPSTGLAKIRRQYKRYYWLADMIDELNKK